MALSASSPTKLGAKVVDTFSPHSAESVLQGDAATPPCFMSCLLWFQMKMTMIVSIATNQNIVTSFSYHDQLEDRR
jgi:hypothetical protein